MEKIKERSTQDINASGAQDIKLRGVLQLNSIVQRFLNSHDCIGKISSISTRKNSNLLATHIFGLVNINFNVKTLDLC